MPDEVVRLPKVSQAALGRFDREIDPRARLDLQGIHAERHASDSREMPLCVLLDSPR
jgi:hypothetical protein